MFHDFQNQNPRCLYRTIVETYMYVRMRKISFGLSLERDFNLISLNLILVPYSFPTKSERKFHNFWKLESGLLILLKLSELMNYHEKS